MAEKIGMFQESPGATSSMRIMSFISLIASITFALMTFIIMIFIDATKLVIISNSGYILTLVFLVGAFCPKVIQKFAEVLLKVFMKKFDIKCDDEKEDKENGCSDTKGQTQ